MFGKKKKEKEQESPEKPADTVHKKEVNTEGPQPVTTVTPAMSFIFFRKADAPGKIADQLFAGEEVKCCYKTVRDAAVFTNRRMLIRDIEGVTGTKVSTLSIPYKSIRMFSVESAGIVGLDADVVLWTNVGNISLHLSRNIDTDEFCRMIAEEISR